MADPLPPGTIVSVLNRSVQVREDGTWNLPNIPANTGLVRARATYTKDGVTQSGQSDFFLVPANGSVTVPDIILGAVSPIPKELKVTSTATTLTTRGATAQLTATATYPDGTVKDVTSPALGTSFFISNTTIASVSDSGLVTANAAGTVILSATNDGAVGIIQLRVAFSSTDSDGDGIPDEIEVANRLNPNEPVDAKEDPDGDGLSNFEELMVYGTDPFRADTDGDGIKDRQEVLGTLGKVTNPLLRDTDGDGINDALEYQTGTDPTDSNSKNFAAALDSLQVTPSAMVLTVNSILGEASQQLSVVGRFKDGSTLDLTPTSRGTNYVSSNLFVANFGSPDGRVFAGDDGTAVLTVTSNGFSKTVNVTVQSFAPVARSFVDIPGFANAVAVQGSYAYVAAGASGLQVVDVSDPRNPVIVGSLDTPGNANDVRVSGNLAYVADGTAGLRVISIAKPTAPVSIGSVDTPGEAWDLVLVGTRVYLADGSEGLKVIDASVPSVPSIIGSLIVNGTAKGVDVSGTTVALAVGYGGLLVVDVANPAQPVLVGTAAYSSADARDVALSGTYAFVADTSLSLMPVNLANRAAPVVGTPPSISTGGRLECVVMDGRFAIGADINFVNGVPITDVSTPATPVPKAILDFGQYRDDDGHGIAVQGGYAYLAAAYGSAFVENGTYGTSRLYIGQYQVIEDNAGIPPQVFITSPASGATVTEGSTITVKVNASDDVEVAAVRLLVNGVQVNSDSGAPYELTYDVPLGATTLTLQAQAVDFGNNATTSASVVVNVSPDLPPTATIAAPAEGAVLFEEQTVTFTGSAVDDLGVVSMKFYVEGVLADTDTSAPYQTTFVVPLGVTSRSLRVEAVDTAGHTATSATRVLQVVPDPKTTVIGKVVDPAGASVVGAAVTLNFGGTATTAINGSFSISNVPTVRGNIVASVTANVGGKNLKGTSAAIPPNPGAVTDLGIISFRDELALLIVCSDSSPPTSQMLASGYFSKVDVYYSNYQTPTLSYLQQYDAVLHYSNNYPGDANALGNVLADFVDAGGAVALATYSYSSPWSVAGRIMQTGYSPFKNVQSNGTPTGNLVAVVPGHPIFEEDVLTGLHYFNNYNFARPTLDTNAILLATDGSGVNMIAVNAAGNMVGLNLFPALYGGNNENVYKLIANAVFYVGGGSVVSKSPKFTTHPADQTVNAGLNATFSVVVTGDPAPSIKWQRSVNSGASWTDLVNGPGHNGVTTSVLSVMNLTANQSGHRYRVVATNTLGSMNSNSATLLVSSVPVIVSHPTSATLFIGDEAVFEVAVAGHPAPQYQWQISTNGGDTWTDLVEGAAYVGVQTASLHVPDLTLNMSSSRFRVVVTNALGATTSNAATLTVRSAPVITQHPADVTVNSGSAAQFSIVASGTPEPSYQWQEMGQGGFSWTNLENTGPYSGTHGTTLTVTSSPLLGGMHYRCVATNIYGSRTSDLAHLFVNYAPIFSTQPANWTVIAGDGVMLTAGVNAVPMAMLQWQTSVNGGGAWTDLVDDGVFTGTNTHQLSFMSTLAQNGHLFRLRATNNLGTTASNPATLTVTATGVMSLQLTPATLTSTSTSSAVLQIKGMTAGDTAAVERFVDVNGNGIIDAADFLAEKFAVTSGEVASIGGVRNPFVAGDEDGAADGQISVKITPSVGSEFGRLAGAHILRVSSPFENFAPLTTTLTLTQPALAQSFTGTITDGANRVPYASVVLLDASTEEFVVGALANSTGKYTITAPPGTYKVVAFKSGFVTNFAAAPPVALAAGATVSRVVTLTAATTSISGVVTGQFVAEGFAESGFSGVQVFATSQGGLAAVTQTDDLGHYLLPVTSGIWSVTTSEESLRRLGYVGVNYDTTPLSVSTQAGAVTGANHSVYPATALIQGTVRGPNGNPLPGIMLDASHNYGTLEVGNLLTDAAGHYVMPVTDGPWVIYIAHDSPGLTGLLVPDGTEFHLNYYEVRQADFSLVAATTQITGSVKDGGNLPISGVRVYASSTLGGVNFSSSATTSATGQYSLAVCAGHWTVSVAADELRSRGYVWPSEQTAMVAGAPVIRNFVAPQASATIFGSLKDDHGTPITGVPVYGESTFAGVVYYGTALTNELGNYSLPIFPGSWAVSVSEEALQFRGYVAPMSRSVMVPAGTAVLNLVAPVATGAVTGSVTDENFAPISGVRVFGDLTLGNVGYAASGVTDDDGLYFIPLFNGNWSVSVDNDDLQALGYVIPEAQEALVNDEFYDLNFTAMSASASIKGFLRNPQNQPIAGVQMFGFIAADGYHSFDITNTLGAYTLPATAGLWNVGPSAEDLQAQGYLPPVNQDVLVNAGGISMLDFVANTPGGQPQVASAFVAPLPEITLQPASQSVVAGQKVAFRVATSGGSVSLQWQVSSNDGTTWTEIGNGASYKGATSAVLYVTTDLDLNGRRYRCVVTHANGTLISSGAVLTVRAPRQTTP
ncbi:carboxypeptidase regulatory-like domain-containing protein [Brevifollis gellanilyticus]|uniref:Ig-like domain-containing protein n=1 Tax=Brevifollis gellanilyticus TaxID=748831 RepID=A0A512M5R8_9BACT|nr:carboxypeptidase regulatory-like domain-containing protein [Brevifollis gellanilyticus]GEP42064.1 hypothetical protein BGE01nite_13550 [Brevifollis gellanilyticus]